MSERVSIYGIEGAQKYKREERFVVRLLHGDETSMGESFRSCVFSKGIV